MSWNTADADSVQVLSDTSLNGDRVHMNIVIRTAVYQDGIYHLGVGGGITCESRTRI